MSWSTSGTGVNGTGKLTCAAAAVSAAMKSTPAMRVATLESVRAPSADTSVVADESLRMTANSNVCVQY